MNVGDLDGLMEKLAAENNLGEKAGVPFLDLGKLGYNKLLGMGKMTKRISIKVQSYSKSAAKKVEAIGGELVTETK